MMGIRTTLRFGATTFVLGAMSWACTDVPTTAPIIVDPPAQMRSVEADVEIQNAQRTPLQDGIVHYTYDLVLGPGPFDVVRLHRIVRERAVNDRAPSIEGVFLLPGAPNSWIQIFVEPLISDVPPRDQSVAIFLAENGVDVWGIDYAWAQVPLETTDFGFMAGWGVQKDVDFAYEALKVARSIRVSTGQGNGRLHVLGFSYGVPIAYGLAGQETQLPPGQRVVKGIIPIDYELKFEDPARRAKACANAERDQGIVDSGTYEDGSFVPLLPLAALAESTPDAPSPVPGLSVLQFIWYATTGFVGQYVDASGIPVGLRFTEPTLWLHVLQNTRPYWPRQAGVDLKLARCETGTDVPFDDHLGEITVPILNVGSAGGTGMAGNYTASLTATRDFESFVVRTLSDDERMYDFGHADLFTARDAEARVWRPILEWLLDRRENRTFPAEPNG
jgi:hypothetical protein